MQGDSSYDSAFSHRNEICGVPTEIIIKIISATYGPYESDYDDLFDARIPLTRDCAPFIRNLLIAALKREEKDLEQKQRHYSEQQQEQDKCNNVVRVSPTVNGKIQGFIHLSSFPSSSTESSAVATSITAGVISGGGRELISMNAVFGDPSPGISKRLSLCYKVTEAFTIDSRIRTSQPPRTEIHRVSFAEHETVKLRRCLVTMNITRLIEGNADNDDTPEKNFNCSSSDQSLWQLQPETSEIILPIFFPFLNLRERMQCRLICRCWKKIVQECGVSKTIDVNDPSIMRIVRTTTGETSSYFTRSILRGLLAYSYSSLRSLYLSGFDIRKEDLHSAIPHLKNLYALDVSRCHRLDDSTLQLLSRPDVPCSATLRVL